MGGVWTRRGICGEENRHEGVCVGGGTGGTGLMGRNELAEDYVGRGRDR